MSLINTRNLFSYMYGWFSWIIEIIWLFHQSDRRCNYDKNSFNAYNQKLETNRLMVDFTYFKYAVWLPVVVRRTQTHPFKILTSIPLFRLNKFVNLFWSENSITDWIYKWTNRWMNKNMFEKNMYICMHGLNALSARATGRDWLKTLYMYRYNFEHAEQQIGSASLCLSMCLRNVILCCLDKTATYTFDTNVFCLCFFAFMRHEQFLRFKCSTPLTTFVLRLCIRSLTLRGCICLTKYLLHCAQSKLAAVYCVKWDSKSSYWQRSFHILHMRVYDLAIPFSLVFLACRSRQASIVLERYFFFDKRTTF